MEFTKIEDKKSIALSKQLYSTDVGYKIKVVTIGIDTHITGTPPIEYSHIAPVINFISKESRALDYKASSFSMDDISLFRKWTNIATDLLEYIYEHYEDFVKSEPEKEM